MKKIKKFLIIPLVSLLFGLLPPTLSYADDLGIEPYVWTGGYSDFLEKMTNIINDDNPIELNGEIVDSLLYQDRDSYKNVIAIHMLSYPYTRVYCTNDDIGISVASTGAGSSININHTNCSYVTWNYKYKELSTVMNVASGSGVIGNETNLPNIKILKGSFFIYNSASPGESVEIQAPTDSGRIEEMPTIGNGIFVTSPKNNSKINKLEYNDRGYLEQIFTLKVQYKPKESFFGLNDEEQKMDIIKGISCEMEDSDFNYHIFNDSFRWIVKPSDALDSVSKPYALAEIKISTVFKDLGKKKFSVTSALKVADDSFDFETYSIREYTDSIYVEFVSDENYNDGVVINPDGSTGTDGSNSDINLDGFPTAPGSGATIVDWVKYFGDVIIWLVTYPFKLLANCFTVLGGYITVMVKTLQSTSEQITGLFTFIPKDILNVTYGIISFTLLYSVTRGVLRLIRGN